MRENRTCSWAADGGQRASAPPQPDNAAIGSPGITSGLPDSSQPGEDSVGSAGALSYAFGGPGLSVPMGLFMAGVFDSLRIYEAAAKMGRRARDVPGWAGELSWFHLMSPKALFLIPLVRFPGFIWLIATGFMLPRTVTHALRPSEMPA